MHVSCNTYSLRRRFHQVQICGRTYWIEYYDGDYRPEDITCGIHRVPVPKLTDNPLAQLYQEHKQSQC